MVTPSLGVDSIRLGSVTTNRKGVLTGASHAVGTDSQFISAGPSRMSTVPTASCHVSHLENS